MRNISAQGAHTHKVLSEYSAGGVRLISGNERITIDNTLDERLRLLEEQVRYRHAARYSRMLLTLGFNLQMLPEIRTDLFGLNENRKFYT